MWKSGFFNSVNGDRLYNAETMNDIFEGLITDGVYESVRDKLAVQPSGGMGVQIATGRGWFNKHWVDNTTAHVMSLAAADVTLNRYCAVCIRVDTSDSVRTAEPYLKYSDFATTPVKPAMTRSEYINEYCLAYVYIKAGATEIKAADIEDTRANESLCGWVTGLIEQLSSATLFEQFTDIFNEWFTGLQSKINENTETMLVAALPVSLTVTLTPAKWTAQDGICKQNVTVTGMTSTKSVMVQPSSDSVTNYAAAEVRCTAQSTNTLEFTAISLPTANIVVDILHMGA